jgi:predicted MFS family arabinose efflux permease
VLGWQSVLYVASAIATTSALSATFLLKPPATKPRPFSFPEAVRNYKLVFANPKAPLCFSTVFLEGVALFGITPYVSEFLQVGHLGGVREAGIIIGSMGIGGIIYSLVLPQLLKRASKFTLLGTGGIIAAAAPLALAFAPSWIIIALAFAVAGFGYMLMHNSIQSEAVELAPDSRVSAYSMHAFSFFTGQSLGPILAGWLLHGFGATTMLLCSAAVLAATGLTISRLFIRLAKPA